MPHSFLGFQIARTARGWRGERAEGAQAVEARTLRMVKTMIRALVAARRTGVIR